MKIGLLQMNNWFFQMNRLFCFRWTMDCCRCKAFVAYHKRLLQLERWIRVFFLLQMNKGSLQMQGIWGLSQEIVEQLKRLIRDCLKWIRDCCKCLCKGLFQMNRWLLQMQGCWDLSQEIFSTVKMNKGLFFFIFCLDSLPSDSSPKRPEKKQVCKNF